MYLYSVKKSLIDATGSTKTVFYFIKETSLPFGSVFMTNFFLVTAPEPETDAVINHYYSETMPT